MASRALTARFSRALSSWFAIGLDRPEARASTPRVRCLAQRALQQFRHVADQDVEVERLRLQRLPAGEREQPRVRPAARCAPCKRHVEPRV